jgi:hypothetical protein
VAEENKDINQNQVSGEPQASRSTSSGRKNKKKRTLLQRIVNVFLFIGIGLLILLILAFGITQTSAFREYLRELVLDEANAALNGKLYIEKIDGTIFTSLVLRNTVVSMKDDTLLNAGTIGIKVSPLQLLWKKIYVRDFEIRDADINLITESDGELNFAKLFPPSEPDTTESEFPFKIEIAGFTLQNVDFAFQNFNKAGSNEIYEQLNTDDIRLDDLNLSLKAVADINENAYELALDNLSFKPNIKSFNLNEISGGFLLNEKNILVSDFHLRTGESEILLNANMKGYNIFDTTATSEDLRNALINLDLNLEKLSFKDAASFSPSLELLKGSVSSRLETRGTLEELMLNHLQVELENSNLEAKGTIRNIDDPESMFFTVDFYDSYIKQEDIKSLIPSLEMPVYKELGELRFDTLYFEGKPLDFQSKIQLTTDKGILAANSQINLSKEPMEYDIKFSTKNLDLSPFAEISTNLNTSGDIKGSGDTPENMNAKLNFNAGGSVVEGNRIDTLYLIASALNKVIEYDINLTSDTAGVNIKGDVDFTQQSSENIAGTYPVYTVNGTVRNLNLAQFTKDTSLQTDLNFFIDASGESFDQDEMNLFLNMRIQNSYVNNMYIDSTRAIIDLERQDGQERIINVVSDLADITLRGNFTISQTINLISGEADLLSKVFLEKINKFFPGEMPEEGEQKNLSAASALAHPNPFTDIDSTVHIDYLVELKDFDLLSFFLGKNQLEIDGEVSGTLRSSADSVYLIFNSTLDYIKYWGEENVFFLSNLNMGLDVANSFTAFSSDDILSNLNISVGRIFTGTDVNDLSFKLNLKNDKADLSFSTEQGNNNIELSGAVDISGNMLLAEFNTLKLNYNKFSVVNKEKIELAYSEDSIAVKNLNLSRNGGTLEASGYLSRYGNQKLNLSLKNLSGEDLSINMFNLHPDNSLGANITLLAEITGNYAEPVINFDLLVDKVTYKDKNFGMLKSNLKYRNNNLNVNVDFINPLFTSAESALKIRGNVPMNLSFEGADERLMETKPIDLNLTADNFNLGAFGDLLPYLNKLRGNLTADLKITGTINSPVPQGSLKLRNGGFLLESNNLEYNAGLAVNIDGEDLSLDSFYIANVAGTTGGGSMTGSGTGTLENFNLTSSEFSLSGNLKVLGEESKPVSPSIYGNLIIETRGAVELKMDEERIFLNAPIKIKEANLTFPPAQGGYTNASENFIYKYLTDTSGVKGEEMDFESLVNLSKHQDTRQRNADIKKGLFDYHIEIDVDREATFVFVLSKEFNQKLTAVLKGNMQYERIGGKSIAYGELRLLAGSTLEFLKSWEASGSMRFESDITNPNLDVTATYTDFYEPKQGDEAGQLVEVAVKIKIEGPLKELDKRLIQGEDNIAVYYGSEDIQKNRPNPSYDASDAVMFVLLGKFNNDATQQDRNAVASTASSLAGSVLGSFLNSQVGDIIKSVELRQVGATTRITLMGRTGNFRYEIGTSTDVYRDLSKANVKIEYPFFRRIYLRLERKEAVITESRLNTDMINELGLRYRFEF